MVATTTMAFSDSKDDAISLNAPAAPFFWPISSPVVYTSFLRRLKSSISIGMLLDKDINPIRADMAKLGSSLRTCVKENKEPLALEYAPDILPDACSNK